MDARVKVCLCCTPSGYLSCDAVFGLCVRVSVRAYVPFRPPSAGHWHGKLFRQVELGEGEGGKCLPRATPSISVLPSYA